MFLFLISLIWLLGIVFITTLLFPGMVTPLSDKEWYLDVLMAMVVIAAGIFSITTLMVEAYETERRSKEALLEEMEALAALSCDFIQGYYYSKPLPPEEFVRFLQTRNRAA